ncbi:glycosyltransferase family 4 protein [Prochlorothrix hollandica]|uniref:Glycosyltransferase n=1 Tax=Prochlorothrix hollandica PCC 9006 = CALU 1027 TaxID=317619 RepID=A0A0M2PV37_PROHO|nr:glycosyltransferase family 4 protein [Prochlorothrix hollandica]KKI98518.1 glycosyltransferase [Prochlorothrix hollandica PCC 9006 = CALU 1027]
MINKSNQKKFHLWIPSLFSMKGGIETYSMFVWEAIKQNIYDGSYNSYNIFIKNDTAIPTDFVSPSTEYTFAGKIPSPLRTIIFSIQLIVGAIWKKPNLIITTHLNFIPVAHFLKTLLGIPYYTVAHGIEAWNIENHRLITALKDADKILAVSNYTRDKLIKEQNLNPDNILVLTNTFDHQKFKISAKTDYLLHRHHLKRDTKIILTIARLSASEQYKGFDQIIRSLPQIIIETPNIHYVLVGKGDDRARIENLVKGLQLENYVTLAGFIPDEELCDYYNLCDVFAMPSKGEGFGIVYLEAMACGKPCLGGNQDGALDALDQGEIGVLVNPDDIDEIAEALIQILQKKYPNPLLYQPEQLRQAVIDRFGFEIFQQRLHEYLDDFMTCL